MHRHGDRTPVATFPADSNNDNPSNWPQGLGQLTNLGKLQCFELGQFIRQRYGQRLIPSTYSDNDIYIRSTDVERVLASANDLLAGLYPPATDEHAWNTCLPWQPIAVHTVPSDEEWLIFGDVPKTCARLMQLMESVMQLPEIVGRVKSMQPTINFVNACAGHPATGDMVSDMTTFLDVRDTIYVESVHNKT